jgi:hypothetical protein
MPASLHKAHQVLNKAVDAAYDYKADTSYAPRVAFLFTRYQALTSLLPATQKPKNALVRFNKPKYFYKAKDLAHKKAVFHVEHRFLKH